MKGVLHEILAKIEAVWNNWHAHANPDAQVKKAQAEFMSTAADLIHELEAKVSELGGEASGGLGQFVEDAKRRLEDLENLAKNFVTTTALEPLHEELAAMDASVNSLKEHGAALEARIEALVGDLSAAKEDLNALKAAQTPPAPKAE